MRVITFSIPGIDNADARSVSIKEQDGIKVLRMLDLPVLPEYSFTPEQLPFLTSAIADHIQYDGPAANIMNAGRRYSTTESVSVEYIHRSLRELAILAHYARQHAHSLQWVSRDC